MNWMLAMSEQQRRRFQFRPWVRRAGLSIVAVAAAATFALAAMRTGERAIWVYVVALWIGGLKVFLGTLRPVAESDAERLIVRRLHLLGAVPTARPPVRGPALSQGGGRPSVY